MSKKVKVMLIVLGVVLLALTYSIWQHHQKFSPVINSKPSQFITVSGHLAQGFYLKIGASYATDEKICWHYSNYVQGLTQPNFYRSVYTPTVDSNNNYSVKIPLDALQPGHCGWGIGNLFYVISDNKNFQSSNHGLLVGFYDQSKPAVDPSFSLICNVGKQNHEVSCRFPRDMRTDFDLFNLYTKTIHIEINFIKEN